jgi:hypothetical protein
MTTDPSARSLSADGEDSKITKMPATTYFLLNHQKFDRKQQKALFDVLSTQTKKDYNFSFHEE